MDSNSPKTSEMLFPHLRKQPSRINSEEQNKASYRNWNLLLVKGALSQMKYVQMRLGVAGYDMSYYAHLHSRIAAVQKELTMLLDLVSVANAAVSAENKYKRACAKNARKSNHG